jgi:hypothetical protein
MRAIGVYCLIGLFLAGGAACGGGKLEEAKQAGNTAAETAAAVKEAAGGGGGDAAKGMQDFAKAMEQMQTAPDGTAYETVSFKALEEFLPELAGWEREKPEGESMTAPVKFSKASTAYTKDDARIQLEITDTAMAKMMTLPYQMFLLSGYNKESSSGYEKSVKVGGNPGWEKWDSESKRAELGMLVGQRFLVAIDGSNTDVQTVKDLAAKIDLGKLAGLK